jgi:hypothetical protein
MVGGLSLLTVFVCIAFQAESRGISLEGLDSAFEVSPWRKIMHRRMGDASAIPQIVRHDDTEMNNM